MTPIEEAVAAVERGELIAFPTDTVYGIAALPSLTSATAALFEAKGRPRDLALPILAPDPATARAVAVFDAHADALADAFWPGPVTIVLPRSPVSEGWDLGGDRGTIGIRVPRHPIALAVLARSGALAVSSANRSGHPTATTCDELTSAFGDRVAVYLCEESPLVGVASTVVDLAHGSLEVLRSGDIARDVLERVLGGEGPLLDSRPPA